MLPATGELYANDNGRDLLGDDFPPCELNRIEAGGFYGWPYANGDKVPDPNFGEGEQARIAASIAPAHAFGAHNAPLGIAFVSDLGPLYDSGDDVAIVALHGSWNRRDKDGYKVVSLHWQPDESIVERDFLTGFLEGNDVIGRPVDVVQGPDGAIYVSDDYANVIWRVSRTGEGPVSPGVATLVTNGPAADALAGLSATEIARLSAQGGGLYATNDCASCHEAEAAGEGVVVKPLVEIEARYDVDELMALLRTPPSPMPMPEINEDQRKALAVFLLSRDH